MKASVIATVLNKKDAIKRLLKSLDGQTRRLSRKEVRAVTVKAPDPTDLFHSRRVPAGQFVP